MMGLTVLDPKPEWLNRLCEVVFEFMPSFCNSGVRQMEGFRVVGFIA